MKLSRNSQSKPVLFLLFQKAISLYSGAVLALVSIASSVNAEPAKQADKFVDSMCVNTHPWYSWNQIKPKLKELGIRYIREGRNNPALYRDLYQNYGIKIVMIADPHKPGNSPQELLTFVKEVGPNVFATITGSNEVDLFIKGDWKGIARDSQKAIWQRFKGDPATKNIKIAGPSVVMPNAARSLGNLSQWLEYADLHNYQGGREPEIPSLEYGSLDWNTKNIVEPIAPGKPIISTEAGYHNANRGLHPGVSEQVAGQYIPRLYAFQFKKEVVRTCIYELWDQGTDKNEQEANFGILRHNYSNKPAFEAVKNLIALLSDRGTDFEPGSLDYKLSGNQDKVHTLLLQKRNGNYFLGLWLGVSAADAKQRDITVSLPTAIKGAVIHRLSPLGKLSSENATVANGQLRIQVGGTLAFIEVNTGGSL